MTAENVIENIAADKPETTTAAENNSTNENVEIPTGITEIFEFLSQNAKIVFQSQQIDDPELQPADKQQIARDIYLRNRQTFLMRFGSYFEERHLNVFTHFAIDIDDMPSKREMELLVLDYRNKLRTRKLDVKNRRYAAMQQMIEEGEYFSEQEMMKRAPELYQDLVGQYLSAAEKKQRDSYDVRNTTFSGILMHTMERQELADVLEKADENNKRQTKLEEDAIDKYEKQQIEEEEEVEEAHTTRKETKEESFDEVPASYRQQWGNFDNEQIACSTSRVEPKQKTSQKSSAESKSKPQQTVEYITDGERELLRQEFMGIMYEKFLSGQDADFDYSQVDDNSQLDDLQQLNQDKEDAYFEDSDEEDVISANNSDEGDDKNEEDESEDELDIYMSHLSKHHSLQK